MTLWVSSQGPTAMRDASRRVLGLDPRSCGAVRGRRRRLRPKQGVYVEFSSSPKPRRCSTAGEVGRDPLRRTCSRWGTGRAQVHYAELGLKRDGTIVGCAVRSDRDAGAYPLVGAFLPFFTQMMSQQVYRTPKIEFNWQAAHTNTTPTRAYRGAGGPRRRISSSACSTSRADELDIDPVEIRRSNFIPTTRSRTRRSPGDVRLAATTRSRSTAVLEHAGYDALRAEQAARRERNDPNAARHRSLVLRRDHRAGRLLPRVGQGRDRGRRNGARVRRYERRTARVTRPRSR
jgi:carbon-monoxide dehydrogenase large subunit